MDQGERLGLLEIWRLPKSPQTELWAAVGINLFSLCREKDLWVRSTSYTSCRLS
jgi:hypothetical protein